MIGPEPCRFLTTNTSTAAWALRRTSEPLRILTTVFGTPTMSVAQFPTPHAARVQITDLRGLLSACAVAGRTADTRPPHSPAVDRTCGQWSPHLPLQEQEQEQEQRIMKQMRRRASSVLPRHRILLR
ncbi:hypothetical protein GCM10010330_36060 [Streptomyces tendae]|nr:hypothetical protein GCM10010330_36060 [Streptomyces tendae]